MPELERIQVTRRIPAKADRIFDLVRDPQVQIQIDGSGMLISTPDGPMTAVGDAFEMNMDREPLGDVPLGKYRVVNTVTRFVRDRHFEWNVAWPESPPFGHVYGYMLEPINAVATDVSSYCDWSSLSEAWRGHIVFPVIPASMLEDSLERLRQIAIGPPVG